MKTQHTSISLLLRLVESYRKTRSYTCSSIRATYCTSIYVDRLLMHDRLEFSWFDIENFHSILPQLSTAHSPQKATFRWFRYFCQPHSTQWSFWLKNIWQLVKFCGHYSLHIIPKYHMFLDICGDYGAEHEIEFYL